MLAAVVLLRRNGYDPIEVAKMLDDDDLMEKICGRRPRFEDRQRQRDPDKFWKQFEEGGDYENDATESD